MSALGSISRYGDYIRTLCPSSISWQPTSWQTWSASTSTKMESTKRPKTDIRTKRQLSSESLSPIPPLYSPPWERLNMSPTTGSCLCRAITYQIEGPPGYTGICHCTNCRKWTGSMFTANSGYMKSQVSLLTGEEYLKTYVDSETTSGLALMRQFCGKWWVLPRAVLVASNAFSW